MRTLPVTTPGLRTTDYGLWITLFPTLVTIIRLFRINHLIELLSVLCVSFDLVAWKPHTHWPAIRGGECVLVAKAKLNR